jgi:hypothetical protein
MVVDYSKWDNLSVYSSSDGDQEGQEEEEEDEEPPPPPSALFALPHALWALIFALLPTEERLRCAAVCRAWRAALHAAAPEVWAELWFVRADNMTDEALSAAAALAQGRLRILDLTAVRGRVREPALLRVLAANSATLRALRLPQPTTGLRFALSPGLHQRIMAAAPGLRLLFVHTLSNTHAGTPAAEAARLLRRPNVRVQALHVSCFRADADDMAALTRALAKRGAPLRELSVEDAAAAALHALLGAACAHGGLERVCFENCALGPAALPALARLLRGGTLAELEVLHNARYTPPTALLGGDDEEEDEAADEDEEEEEEEQEAGGGIGAAGTAGAGGQGGGGGGGGGIGGVAGIGGFGAPAVAADVMTDLASSFTSPTCALTSLSVHSSLLFRVPAAAAALLAALTGHPRLATLHLFGNRVSSDAQRAAAGASLGALLAANAPALTDLDVSSCNLGDEGLGPLFEALPRNTHLRILEADDNAPTRAFLRGRVLPALRANASLRKARVVAQAMPRAQQQAGPDAAAAAALTAELEAAQAHIAARAPVV